MRKISHSCTEGNIAKNFEEICERKTGKIKEGCELRMKKEKGNKGEERDEDKKRRK
jgi:hypothetical protein